MEESAKSNLDLVNECDSFPYYQTEPEIYLQHISTYYHLRVNDVPYTLGYLLPSVAEVLRGLPAWSFDELNRTLTLVEGKTAEERSEAVARTTQAMRETSHFKVLKGWRDELYPVYGLTGELLFNIERSATPLFGVVTYGVHMTAFVSPKDGSEMKIWTPKRAMDKQTYAGMLDNTVGGGIASGESAFESIVREAKEEASLPEQLVREKAKPCGTVTYFYIRDSRAGGETRLLQPECQFIYDLELSEDVTPAPGDNEVESYRLLSVGEVQEELRKGQFKPNCAAVMLDFLIRHGIITAENEKDYIEISTRLHRRLEFPTM